ncbi:MAG: hypothetical protein HDT28_08025 [Clostridiales bacterium]|nr:hypothetical protein [Clostridiales bacterium]
MKISYGAFEEAKTVTLANKVGLEITLCALGAGIMSVKLADKDGVRRELTRLPDGGYGKGNNGLTVGRTAGRIENAEFVIDGRVARLEKNNKGVDNLHSGSTSFGTKIFDLKVSSNKDYADAVFGYFSPDGEGGFFGAVDIKITYRVYENEKRFSIFFDGMPDSKLLLNMTNHVGWDMSGDRRQPITEQTVYINADKVGELNERLIVQRKIDCPEQFDFTTPRKLGDYVHDESVQRYTFGYDHPFFLKERGLDKLACALSSTLSGIRLDVRTTYPCVVLFGDNFGGYKSACFECQYHPNGVNDCPEDCGICTPDKPYHEVIDYTFLIKN